MINSCDVNGGSDIDLSIETIINILATKSSLLPFSLNYSMDIQLVQDVLVWCLGILTEFYYCILFKIFKQLRFIIHFETPNIFLLCEVLQGKY